MRLKSISANNVVHGLESSWELKSVAFDKINLIVGKNASGKSRILGFINTFALMLCGKMPVPGDYAKFNMEFDDSGIKCDFEIEYNSGKIIGENYTQNDQIFLRRNADGMGELLTESIETNIDEIIGTSPIAQPKTTGKKVPTFFKVEDSKPATFMKRDPVLSPYLETLWEWSSQVKKYDFNLKLGQEAPGFGAFPAEQIDFRDQTAVIAMYRDGVKKHPDFKVKIIDDMATIGYFLDDIQITHTDRVQFSMNMNGPGFPIAPEFVSIKIKEKEIPFFIEQFEISTGMFRALSLIIQLNYSSLNNLGSTILIDDIGEGLDYDRASSLIDFVIKMGESSDLQIIMSTNDRFVMNKVPLRYWAVINRAGSIVKVDSLKNKTELIEAFDFTGLSNFDFFTSDFLEKGEI